MPNLNNYLDMKSLQLYITNLWNFRNIFQRHKSWFPRDWKELKRWSSQEKGWIDFSV